MKQWSPPRGRTAARLLAALQQDTPFRVHELIQISLNLNLSRRQTRAITGLPGFPRSPARPSAVGRFIGNNLEVVRKTLKESYAT